MVNCPKCGKENPEDAEYCNNCGVFLKKTKSEYKIEKNIEHFGEEMEKIGKKIEQKGKNIETWYHTKFGIFGPILSGLMALVILLIVIRLFSYFGTNKAWMISVSTFLENFIILFLIIFLLSGFSSYFSKKYKGFRFFSPLIGTVVFVFWFWVAIRILEILSDALAISFFRTLSDIFELLIIPLAFLILLLGYFGIFVSSVKHVDKHVSKKTETKTSESRNLDYKRLYRSGKERILGGVCSGLAEYFRIDPVIIRIIFVIGLIVSFGFMILAYLIFWIIVPRNPNHEW